MTRLQSLLKKIKRGSRWRTRHFTSKSCLEFGTKQVFGQPKKTAKQANNPKKKKEKYSKLSFMYFSHNAILFSSRDVNERVEERAAETDQQLERRRRKLNLRNAICDQNRLLPVHFWRLENVLDIPNGRRTTNVWMLFLSLANAGKYSDKRHISVRICFRIHSKGKDRKIVPTLEEYRVYPFEKTNCRQIKKLTPQFWSLKCL